MNSADSGTSRDLTARRAGVRWLDLGMTTLVRLGGYSVVALIVLLFGYLLAVALPLFASAQIDPAEVLAADLKDAVLIDSDDSGERVIVLARDGRVTFAGIESSASTGLGPVAAAVPVAGLEHSYAVLGLDGELRFHGARFANVLHNGERVAQAALEGLFDEQRVDLNNAGESPLGIDAAWAGEALFVLARYRQALTLVRFADADPEYEPGDETRMQLALEEELADARIGSLGRWLYLVYPDSSVQVVRIGRRSLQPGERLQVADSAVTASAMLSGGESLLLADNNAVVHQLALARDSDGALKLAVIRQFHLAEPAVTLIPEPRRKGFAAITDSGRLRLFHATTHRALATAPGSYPSTSAAAFSLNAQTLLSVDAAEGLRRTEVDNPHPEVSLAVLFGRVWYEGYLGPDYVWQSSAADTAFEPKFSLTPLLFGTLKAAAYALLFAIPLAVLAAIYTGFFMAPAMRQLVKPGIELIAALPTVILGFIAGLWLAPLIERNLAVVFALLVVMPLGLLVLAATFNALPERVIKRCQGWYGLLAVPAVVLLGWASIEIAPLAERGLFGGDTRVWLLDSWGIGYDQRNALVVGIAMGFAVMPTIFAIAEDAIHQVPMRLRSGALALGATQWQTLTRVVLLAASPGILSAIMVGTGRAIGETMIVLMATGNTPIMEVNIFEGMRTFAANIAVELPESEQGGSHFRLLFFTAVVLFVVTFAFNTLAELVRSRLRHRYGRAS